MSENRKDQGVKLSLYFIDKAAQAYLLPFQFDQFESMDDCTCVNHEFIFSGSGQKSFRMYNLHTLISSLKILPVLVDNEVL